MNKCEKNDLISISIIALMFLFMIVVFTLIAKHDRESKVEGNNITIINFSKCKASKQKINNELVIVINCPKESTNTK